MNAALVFAIVGVILLIALPATIISSGLVFRTGLGPCPHCGLRKLKRCPPERAESPSAQVCRCGSCGARFRHVGNGAWEDVQHDA